MEDKVILYRLDAKDVAKLKGKYDLILCTYFTAGNFIPPNFSFETDNDGLIKTIPNMEANETFRQVFHPDYHLLTKGGKLMLGSIYLDKDSTRQRQEEFYRKCGMTVITPPSASFTATKEGFWSQRFTRQRIYDYLDWIDQKDIKFVPLDTYDFAMAVIAIKR